MINEQQLTDLAASRGPVVYVEDLARPAMADADRHHLERVLRLRAGDPVVLCDGRGSWRAASFGPSLSWIADEHHQDRAEPEVTISVALPKGDRADWLIQKVTEIGIDRILVIEADHSVVRWERAKASRQLERLARIVRAAAAQSRRAWLPELAGPMTLDAAAQQPGSALAVPGGGPISPAHRNVMIGPEGGWSAAETGRGLPAIGLGPQVLRVETAAIVAGTLLVALRSGLVLPLTAAPKNAFGG